MRATRSGAYNRSRIQQIYGADHFVGEQRRQVDYGFASERPDQFMIGKHLRYRLDRIGDETTTLVDDRPRPQPRGQRLGPRNRIFLGWLVWMRRASPASADRS